jgi:hypothetical protein
MARRYGAPPAIEPVELPVLAEAGIRPSRARPGDFAGAIGAGSA